MIYTFGVATGLRSGAIKRLLVNRIEIHNGERCVFVPKSNRIKYSADRWIPLRGELWDAMKHLVEGRGPNEPILTMPPRGHTAKMINRDLDAARAKWIKEAETEVDWQKREKSDFLRYKDSDNRYVDFHALRHTRGVWLFKHHKAMGVMCKISWAWAASPSSTDTRAAKSPNTAKS